MLAHDAEGEALRAAVCAQPADDLPRHMYSDWLEENDQREQAERIRLELQLARCQPWDALAIQHLELARGNTRRGFVYKRRINDFAQAIRNFSGWLAENPLTHLAVGTGTLEQWQELTARPGFRQIEQIEFTGLTTPIEPLRVLRDSANVPALRSLRFTRANSPAFSEMMRELFAAPLGPRLHELHIRFGYRSEDEDLFEAITDHGTPLELRHFSYDCAFDLHSMTERDGFTRLVRRVPRLEFSRADIGSLGLELIATNRAVPLELLALRDMEINDPITSHHDYDGLRAIRWLDLRGGEFHDGRLYCPLDAVRVLQLGNNRAGTRFDSPVGTLRPHLHWLDLSAARRPELLLDGFASSHCPQLQRLTVAESALMRLDLDGLRSRFGPGLIVEAVS